MLLGRAGGTGEYPQKNKALVTTFLQEFHFLLLNRIGVGRDLSEEVKFLLIQAANNYSISNKWLFSLSRVYLLPHQTVPLPKLTETQMSPGKALLEIATVWSPRSKGKFRSSAKLQTSSFKGSAIPFRTGRPPIPKSADLLIFLGLSSACYPNLQ